jgi:hypothetical protein
MRRHATFTFTLAVLLCLSAASLSAEIWYEDNNLGRAGGMPADFVEKFYRPESFAQASRHIDVYVMRANVLQEMDDAFFTQLLFPYLQKNGIKLALNAGGATWTQASERRRQVFDENIGLLHRLKHLGGRVDYISLQSVLSKPWRRGDGEYPMEKRIDDVVVFAKAARTVYPDVAIGIMDALPSHGKDYKLPYRLLRDALARERIGLSYIHLDISFDGPRTGRYGTTWKTILEVERYVENDLGVAFGMFAKSRRGGQISSKAFYERTMGVLECYAGSGGAPREYVLASNFPHPEMSVPETATGDDYPTMRIVLEFGRRLEQIKKAGSAWAVERSADRRWQRQCGISGRN